MQLFNDQSSLINSVTDSLKAGYKKILCTLPTGGGKTVIFCHLIKRSIEKRGGFVTVLVHRIELLEQPIKTLNALGVKAAGVTRKGTVVLEGGELVPIHKQVKSGFDAYICMVETVHSRKGKGLLSYKNLLDGANFVIVDEAHFTNFVKVLKAIDENKVVVQFTATPLYATKKHKITHYHDTLIQGPSPTELIELNRLVAPRYYCEPVDESGFELKGGEFTDESVVKAYEQQSILESLYRNYTHHQNGEKTVIFTSSISYANTATDYLKEKGLNVRSIDSNTATPESRKDVFLWLRNTPNAVLINVGIATTGTDIPDLKSIILLRATTSLTLFMQMIGRGARVHESKDHFKVFDYGNNVKRLGKWEEFRDWAELIKEAEKPKRQKKADDLGLNVITLPSLFGSSEDDSDKKSGLILLEEDGTVAEKWAYLLGKDPRQMSITELEATQRIKKYKPGWKYRKIFDNWGEAGILSYAELMGYASGWAEQTIKRLS